MGSSKGCKLMKVRLLNESMSTMMMGSAQMKHSTQKNAVPTQLKICLRFIYCCTSLERVTRSWMRPMATTTRQKMTAFAWPTPSQPVRP